MLRWKSTQQREKEYYNSGKNLMWRTPHSLKYWLEFLNIDQLTGLNVEVGCGPNGLYNFSEKVIGLDPINFHKGNFVKGVAEFLPFRSKSVNCVISCNGLDHVQNPKKTLDEMFRVGNQVILWLNVYPYTISRILNKIDKSHMHHFCIEDILVMLPHLVNFLKWIEKPILKWHWKYASFVARLKLLVSFVLKTTGWNVHLVVGKDG